MARYFVPITKEELALKILKAGMKNCEGETLNNSRYVNGNFVKLAPDDVIGMVEVNGYNLDLRNLTETVSHDLEKVDFDCENVSCGEGELEGFHKLDSGLVYLGVMAGGDWEAPVFYIIYWDGKKLRGYIPRDGNVWNYTTRQAYGNDEDADQADIIKHRTTDQQKIDILNGDLIVDSTICNFDHVLLVRDITNRILPKP